jgi:hypothetical protein
MTDISSLPMGIDQNDDELVNSVLNDLNTYACPSDKLDTVEQTTSNAILEDLSDAESESEYEDDEFDDEELLGGAITTDTIIEQLKLPMLIMTIAFIVNLEFIEELLLKMDFLGSGKLNIFGILLKAILVGGIFYVVNKYAL